ncbi:MAG: cation diffusion facilitator family transporter [Methylobacteriaceae bacterium]|nr:cation diffusion facilitator family transporter [Methylobacteriaceae bacterium]
MPDIQALKQKAALASILASAALTLGKFVAGVFSGSLALLSEAGHSFLDTGATVVTYFAVRAAGKPADEEHHYGHGKFEALAALGETGFLFALAAFVVIEAVRRLSLAPAQIDASWPVFGVLIVSIIVDIVRWRGLSKIARETKSDALAADALHFSSDFIASTLVLIGLIAARLGYPQGDTFAAFGIACFIAIAGWRLARRTIDTLLDTAPKGMADRLERIIGRVPGVATVENIKLRPVGAEVLGEIDIGVARTLPIERVSAIRAAVQEAATRAFPDSNLTVTATPLALDDETVLERVLLVSARRRLPIHHVTIQEVGGRRSVSFDLELDGRMPHGKAHEIASDLETSLEKELGESIEVESHIEPLETQELAGQDINPATTEHILAALKRRAVEGGTISDVHNLRVRETPVGLVVNYHCRVDPTLSVLTVHEAVDELDHKLRADIPGIVRVVGHAEPLRN